MKNFEEMTIEKLKEWWGELNCKEPNPIEIELLECTIKVAQDAYERGYVDGFAEGRRDGDNNE